MKVVERSVKKIVIEVTKIEIDKKGFDFVWDEIRNEFFPNLYEIYKFQELNDRKTINIELRLVKY